MRLLCVEDEAALREDIVEYLRMKSYEVDEASSGEEAIERLNRSNYDLVLCDIMMPRMDGYELLQQVRKENNLCNTPFIFLSALNERNDKVRAHDGGCDGFLTKPIDFSVLEATLKAHIDRQRARDFLNTATIDASQRHMMAAIDDALNGPIKEVALATRSLRDSLSSLKPAELNSRLGDLQEKINTHMIDLHTFYSALLMQSSRTECLHEVMAADDLIKQAVEECRQQFPSAQVRFKAGTGTEPVHGDMRMLKRALAGLFATLPNACETADLVRCTFENGECLLTVADLPVMLLEKDYVPVDAATNLAALSDVTRRRLIALSYAMQVVHAHHGKLELMLWPEDHLAVRMILPQPTRSA